MSKTPTSKKATSAKDSSVSAAKKAGPAASKSSKPAPKAVEEKVPAKKELQEASIAKAVNTKEIASTASKAACAAVEKENGCTDVVPEKITVIQSDCVASLAIDDRLNEMIATCAYLMWEEEGYQHGRDREYWLRAECKLKGQFAAAK